MCIVEVCFTLSSGNIGGDHWTARPEQHVKAADGPYGIWHRSFHARFISRGNQDFETCCHVGMAAPVDSLLTSSLCSNVIGSSLCIVYWLRRIRHDYALQDGCSFLMYACAAMSTVSCKLVGRMVCGLDDVDTSQSSYSGRCSNTSHVS
jgi:hypothetical protein